MYCKDCRFWESHTERNKTWTTCGKVTEVWFSDKINENDFAVYSRADDDSGLESGLKTGPMFGCLKFEKKETSCI